MKAFSTLFRVEFRLSLRDMNMPIFAVIMPVVVMLVVGMMFGDQPAYEGASYTFVAQSVGAVSAIGICAGGDRSRRMTRKLLFPRKRNIGPCMRSMLRQREFLDREAILRQIFERKKVLS